jgi:hypothetical protein
MVITVLVKTFDFTSRCELLEPRIRACPSAALRAGLRAR